MQTLLTENFVADRQRQLLAAAKRARLAAQVRAADPERRAPRAPVRLLGGFLVTLGRRLGGAVPTPADPTYPAPEGHAAP